MSESNTKQNFTIYIWIERHRNITVVKTSFSDVFLIDKTIKLNILEDELPGLLETLTLSIEDVAKKTKLNATKLNFSLESVYGDVFYILDSYILTRFTRK